MTTPFEPPQAPAAEAAPTRLFPTLSAAQIARIAAHGRRRVISRGELLVDVGDAAVPLFVVVSGEVQVLRVQDERETLVVNYHAGHFSGEASTIAGRGLAARSALRAGISSPSRPPGVSSTSTRCGANAVATRSQIAARRPPIPPIANVSRRARSSS